MNLSNIQRRALLGLAAISACAQGQGAAPLRIAWDDYPPYQRVTASEGRQKLHGLDIQLAEGIAARAGLRWSWTRMPWARQLASLQDGSLDVMLAASRLPEREAFALWTQPYRPERAALMALASSAAVPVSLKALRAQRIGLIRGTAYPGEFAEAVRDPDFAAQLQLLRHAEQGLRMLREQRLDYLIDDPVTLNYLARRERLPALKVVRWLMRDQARLMVSRQAEAARPGLVAALDGGIAALRADGSRQAMLKAYPELGD